MKNTDHRPWWWWINPWLYARRIGRAYSVSLDELTEASVALWRLQNICREAKIVSKLPSEYTDTERTIEYLSSRCDSCGKHYLTTKSCEVFKGKTP